MCSFSPRYVGAPIYGYFHVQVHQCKGCNGRFSGCLQQNMGESGYAISSWSASAGYLASMLTRVAEADASSARQLLAPSVSICADIQHYLIMTQWITLPYYQDYTWPSSDALYLIKCIYILLQALETACSSDWGSNLHAYSVLLYNEY